MSLNYDGLMSARRTQTVHYSDRETMLYALGIGMGADPMNEAELKYVYEKKLVTVPTMASILVDTFDLGILEDNGVNAQLTLHGEERLTLHQPLPPAADVICDLRMKEVFDKGKDKGALILLEAEVRLESGAVLFTIERSTFARGNGGFGGRKDGAPEPQVIPSRQPDTLFTLSTQPDQALLYRLSGDRNPLHADPAFARGAGFEKPILQGLCTYGTACRAVLSAVCDYDQTRIKSFDVRFSAPVTPGDVLLTEIWDEGSYLVFRTKVRESGAVVLNNGRCNLARG